MFGGKCSSPGYGFVSGILDFFFFFCSLERDPSLWENTWPWEILRIWENFPGIRLGNQDLWGGEKESTFDTGRRVETGTYHWEGRKPFIQTFEWWGSDSHVGIFSCWCQSHFSVIVTVMLSTSSFLRANNLCSIPILRRPICYVYFSRNQSLIRDEW